MIVPILIWIGLLTAVGIGISSPSDARWLAIGIPSLLFLSAFGVAWRLRKQLNDLAERNLKVTILDSYLSLQPNNWGALNVKAQFEASRTMQLAEIRIDISGIPQDTWVISSFKPLFLGTEPEVHQLRFRFPNYQEIVSQGITDIQLRAFASGQYWLSNLAVPTQ